MHPSGCLLTALLLFEKRKIKGSQNAWTNNKNKDH